MSIKTLLSDTGSFVIGILIFLGVFIFPIIFILGGVALGKIILPWLFLISTILLVLNLFIFLPLTLIPKLRVMGGTILGLSSFIFGITAWFTGLIITWSIWGGAAVVFGLFFAGIGVIPMGIIAALISGHLLDAGTLLLLTILTPVFGVGGNYIVENGQNIKNINEFNESFDDYECDEYHNHCWQCKAEISSEFCNKCPICGWYECNECGACNCNRNSEFDDSI